MENWYRSMVKTLQLNDKEERTQQAYSRAVRMLGQFHDKSPDLITEEELRDYLLHRTLSLASGVAPSPRPDRPEKTKQYPIYRQHAAPGFLNNGIETTPIKPGVVSIIMG